MDINISLEFLAKLIGTKPGELSEAIKKDDESLKPQGEIEKHIQGVFSEKLKTVKKDARDEGHGRGKRESLSTTEADIAKKYGVEKAEIPTMIDAIIKATGKEQTITPEMIKQSDTYINDLKAEIDKRTTLETEFNTYKTDVDNSNKKRTVRTRVLSLLEDKQFALPKTEKVRNNLVDSYINELFAGKKIDIKGDDIVVTDENGKPLRNDLMNEIGFDDYAVTVAGDYFEVSNGSGGKTPGATTPPGGGGGGGKKYPKVNSQEEFLAHYNSLETIEEKQEFKAHYDRIVAQGN